MIETTQLTDALLVQAGASAGQAGDFAALLEQLRITAGLAAKPPHAAFNKAQGIFYAYVFMDQRTHLGGPAAHMLESELRKRWPGPQALHISRLERVFDTPGASAGAAPVFHYVVEMDPEAGWMPELSAWYDQEHMPGLAAVSGCIRASRFLNHDHGPLSLACYDLVSEETLGSPPWLAVRGTEWSSRMRPRFTNTRRTMFEILPGR
ncbi:hypothetical protein PMI15_01798 [Polaromonas sp. CF318]|uniref:hypothetical protein n=1 Tax=Polaromonas sp. CF318 TaxID=1144318 RepID=UPI000270DB13|nr:hypothetical protein [Polaromonas sp. CF318]EJL85367.1 hypothetical protein PMI15_01798 [Polaromonas sp. CF318]